MADIAPDNFFRNRVTTHDLMFFFATDEMTAGAAVGASAEGGEALDYVDFYQMLGQPRDAITIQLRSRINELYAEAQAHRDHRNLDKRRVYVDLLQWIPPARSVLLHEGKRAKYDQYIKQAEAGQSRAEFRAFLSDLLGEVDLNFSEGESILGIRTEQVLQSPDPDLPRLSPRLDAAAAAAGEGAARATAAASEAVAMESQEEAFANAGPTPITPVTTPVADAPESLVSFGEVATTPAEEETAVTTEVAPPAPPAPVRTRRQLNPSVQRERATLSAAAIGVFVLFTMLLTLRAVLGVESNLAVLTGIAFVSGFVAWRATRRILLSDIPTS